ncbi:16814_t:CDS:2 [Funneliformis geosporum]|uniref:16814_t:CDS:1 n=1 Tax=Funneliformis geosporum TaxID=1117311 RepID=A0A9W4SV83_9GLOM|nr:16814_t:CDS:2 [Funneliformis geosporum]
MEFALKFEPAMEVFTELVFQKTESQVSYLKTQLRDIQSQLSHQERIFARIEIRRQGTFNKSDYLQQFFCGSCQHYLTEQDITTGNYRLYVSDYANEP